MVRNLGCPHLFFTVSAADLQWHDLHRHMPSFERLSEMTEQVRYRTAANDLKNNPHIAAEYLARRFQAFFTHIIKKMWNVADYWYRFEWQDRGSGHIHGFIWIKDMSAPSIITEESRAKIAEYWSRYVTAINPN